MTLVMSPQTAFSSFLDGLRKLTDEFETCIDFVNESASPLTIKLNSETYISKVRGLILSVASLTLENGKGNKKSYVNLNSDSNSQNEERGKTKESENEKKTAQLNTNVPKNFKPKRTNTQTQTEIQKDGQVKTVEMNCKRLKRRYLISEKRATEIEKADKFLRIIKTEAANGFYILYECLICQWKTNNKFSARNHVQRVHFGEGFLCPSCKNVYFNERSLQRHIPKCKMAKKPEQKKVQIKGIDGKMSKRKGSIKVHLHPHEKNIVENKTASVKKKWKFDPKNDTVRNPFKGFDLEKPMNVKIRINRFQVQQEKLETPEPVVNEIQSPNPDDNSNENEHEKETEFPCAKNPTNVNDSNRSKGSDIQRICSELLLKLKQRTNKD